METHLGFNPRDYQLEFHEAAVSHFRSGGTAIMGVSPPRSGKGSIIAMQASMSASKGNQVLVFVHKAELVLEIQKRLRKQFKTDCGILMRGHKIDKTKLIQVGSVMTMIRRNLDWLNPKLIITDECHRLPSKSQIGLINFFKEKGNPRIIGFTATPTREDKLNFIGVFDKIHQITTWRQQLDRKVLVPCVVKAPKGANLEGIKIKWSAQNGYEFDEAEQAKRFSEERVLSALYMKWMEYTGGRMQTVCFNINKIHNKTVCEFFQARGVNARYVDEKTPDKERAAILDKFYKGPFCEDPIMFLGNISIFSEGIDCPTAKCVIDNFMSNSFAKYVQSTSRVAGAMLVDSDNRKWICDYFKVPHGSLGEVGEWLRLPNGKYYKEKAIVLDFGGNTERHGMLQDYDIVPFDLSGKRKEGGIAPTRKCPECQTVCYASHKICPTCGFDFPVIVKKDEKLYADEVEWGEIDNVKGIQNRVAKMTPKEIWSAETHMLRIIALCKGHPPLWPSVILEKRNEIPWFDKSRESQKYLFQYLEEKEIEKGTHKTYLELRERRVYK